MKIIGLAATLALLTCLPVASLAQGAKPATVKPAPEMKTEMKSESPLLKMSTRKERADADARECLKFPTNREIHICAEKYRP
jgi:hypothetical protein